MVMLVLAPGSERPLLKVVSALGDEPRLLSGVPLPGPAGVCCCVHLQIHMVTHPYHGHLLPEKKMVSDVFPSYPVYFLEALKLPLC